MCMNTYSELLQQATTYFVQGRIEESLVAFEQAIRNEPENAAAYTNYGVVLRALGRLDESRLICERSIRLNANDAVAQSNYGVGMPW